MFERRIVGFRLVKPKPGRSERRRGARRPLGGPRAPTYEDLSEIVNLMRSAAQFSEFRLRSGDIEIEVRRANGVPAAAAAPPRPAGDPVGGEVTLEPAPAALRVPRAHPDPERLAPGTVLLRAPMVGTFYRAPEPGAPPYVEVGTRVEPDSTVCIIEVMKLMNSVPAGCAGVVTQVYVGNAEPVEYGQPLVAIDTTR